MSNAVAELDEILSKKELENELDFERAMILERKLRILIKDHPEFKDQRRKLRAILKAYEDRVWTGVVITETKIHESDLAELIAEQERLFLQRRKKLIKERLKSFSLTQKDFGKILGHTSVSYISELVNGINPFTTHNLIIIHLLLGIDFKDLIPTMLNVDERIKLANVIRELGNPKLKLNEQNLELVAV